MNIEEAKLYLEHTSKDDFNLEEWQKENRCQAIQVVLKELERLNNKVEELMTLYTTERNVKEDYKAIIKKVREMLQKKVDLHKNLDFYEDKELETQVYLNYVACLQDFDEIVERYKVEEK